tara:strand:+ start:5457 stop:6227 length:771 start_codon:yes stop_codon:yes gene_type:complete
MDVSEMPTRPEMKNDDFTSDKNYRGDTIADPVGNAIRQANAEASQYPPFILEQFETSNVNIFGKPFPNNGEALRPNQQYLDGLYEVAASNLEDDNMEAMMQLALAAYGDTFDKIIDSIEWMLCDESGLSKEFRWNNIVAPYGNEAHKFHARRAITKFTYLKSLRALESAPDGILPAWLEAQQEKMFATSANAGLLHMLAAKTRELNENKKFEVSQKALEYNIKLAAQSTADYYSKPRDKKIELVSLEALKGFQVAC